jgi:hypothetical protein
MKRRLVEPTPFLSARAPMAPYVAAAKEAFEPEPTADGRDDDPEQSRAWAHLEADLWPLRRRRRPMLLAGACVAAAAFGVWALLARRAPTPAPAPVARQGTAVAPAPAQVAARPAPPPAEPARAAEPPRVEPPPALVAGRAVAAGGVQARLSARGRGAALPAEDARAAFVLDHGTLEIDAAARATRVDVRPAALRFEAGAGHFSVSARDRDVSVAVSAGEVAVFSGARLVTRVLAGQRWTSARTPLEPAPPPAAAPAPGAGAAAPAELQDCLELVRRPKEAVACLQGRAAATGLDGEVALLEIARIRRDVEGDLAGAERTLAEYRRRFPRGALLPEAALTRAQLLLRLDRPAEALAETEGLGGREAIYWRAVALAKLGRAAEARRALDEYLANPGEHRREAAERRRELGP